MKEYKVNENCIGCGLCVSICPEVFKMGDDGFAKAENGKTSAPKTAEEAKKSCPTEAIEEK